PPPSVFRSAPGAGRATPSAPAVPAGQPSSPDVRSEKSSATPVRFQHPHETPRGPGSHLRTEIPIGDPGPGVTAATQRLNLVAPGPGQQSGTQQQPSHVRRRATLSFLELKAEPVRIDQSRSHLGAAAVQQRIGASTFKRFKSLVKTT